MLSLDERKEDHRKDASVGALLSLGLVNPFSQPLLSFNLIVHYPVSTVHYDVAERI